MAFNQLRRTTLLGSPQRPECTVFDERLAEHLPPVEHEPAVWMPAPHRPDRSRVRTGAAGDGSGDGIDQLVIRYQRARRSETATAIIEQLTPLADYLARRYQRNGIAREDLRQVALLAIFRALDRYEPDRGVAFTTFARRTAEGEIKRYHRDHGWVVRPPRHAQESFLAVRQATEDLSHQLGRPPSAGEVADHLDIAVDEVHLALEAGYRRWGVSHDARPPESSDPHPALATDDPELGRAETTLLVERLLERLGPRERLMLQRRFYDQWTEAEIARELEVSQSYLSRMLRRVLDGLRDECGR